MGEPLPPLVVGVKRSLWRLHDPEREDADEQFRAARRSVLERDRYTCRYCGFATIPKREAPPGLREASGFLEVHHLDDNHANNRPQNLVTVCPFCHQVFHCGNAGQRDAAQVIWLPWLRQEDLNLLVNCAAVALVRGNDAAQEANTLMTWLEYQEGPVVSLYGEAMAHADALGTALMGIHKEDPALYAERRRVLWGVRLLPKVDAFERAVKWWAERAWLPETQWEQIYRAWMDSEAGAGRAV